MLPDTRYTVGRCFECGDDVWEPDDYIYANPFTGERFLEFDSCTYMELFHTECAPDEERGD